MQRRTILGLATASALPRAEAAAGPSELDEISLPSLGAALRSGRYTARALVERYLTRIKEIDREGLALGSVIEVNPDALRMAAELDRQRKEKGSCGPLHGVPVLLKDNIDTAAPMHTSAGSLALADSVAARDSFVAARLRAAGAVLLGKTNLSEWANFRSTHSVSGWSGRGGQTRNPYALDRNPSGSSSGSAVAVASSLCAAAVGTETDGSIVSPSAMCGIVGIKPTLGLISRSGIIPIAHSQDTAGPMARTVRDAAILLNVLAGPDPRDKATSQAAGKGPPDYTKFLDPDGLRGARLGIARKFFGLNAAQDRLFEGLIRRMERQGAIIIDPADLPSHGQFGDAEYQVLLYEYKADLNAYLGSLPPSAPVRSLAGVIDFNEKHRAREMPWFEQEIMKQAQEKGPLSDKAYLDALERCRRLSRAEGIDAVFERHKLDAMVAPTGGLPWLTDWANGDHDTGGCSTPAAVAGYPHITVPAGLVHGLPAGISFFGRAWNEPALIRIAYGFEATVQARRPPRFLPTAELAP